MDCDVTSRSGKHSFFHSKQNSDHHELSTRAKKGLETPEMCEYTEDLQLQRPVVQPQFLTRAVNWCKFIIPLIYLAD